MQTWVRSRAFSLVEVVLALAVISFALVAILGLLPLGLESAQNAVDDTRTSMIAQDAAVRLNAIPITNMPTATQKLTNYWWYDANGRYLGANYATATNALYQVTAVEGQLSSYPANTSPTAQDPANTNYGTQLEGALVIVGWPLNPNSGNPLPNSQSNTYTFYLRATPAR